MPFADAVADPFVELVPVALNDAAPVTFSGRLLVAATSWVASDTATDAPTAAVEADAEPEAEVVTDAVCVAATASVPPSVVGEPVPTVARVVTVEIETATAGATATPPPAAPPTAVVVIVSVLVALSVRSFALSDEPSARSASVVSITRFSATEAPTPAPAPAVAFAVEVVAEVAFSVTLPGVLTPPVSIASVATFAIVSANDPATDTEAAAPDSASLE